MNYMRGFASNAASFALVAILFSGTLAAEDLVHVVARGETVYGISRSYQVSPEELMRFNNITDASKLQVGKRLIIPPSAFSDSRTATTVSASTTARASGSQSFTEYRVVRNDTLYGIARAHGITLQVLLDINGFSQNHVIKAGDRIKIPVTETTRSAQIVAAPALPEARQTSARAVDSSLRWPITPREIAYMTGKLYGVVVQGDRFESVKSLTQGTVMSAGPYRGFGRVVIVEVSGGYLYVYGGCESLSVKKGDRVGPGEELGKLGIDAISQKPQLFFMVYRGNTPIDPAKAPRA